MQSILHVQPGTVQFAVSVADQYAHVVHAWRNDMVELFYAWRKDGEDEAAGANETTNLVVQAMDVQLCDTSEDEDENMESELESDEISEDERHYE